MLFLVISYYYIASGEGEKKCKSTILCDHCLAQYPHQIKTKKCPFHNTVSVFSLTPIDWAKLLFSNMQLSVIIACHNDTNKIK